MAKLYFRYGTGKTSDICQTAYNFNEQGFNVLIINPYNNENLESKIKNQKNIPLLRRKVDMHINKKTNLFEMIKEHKKVECILIDNSEYLTVKQVEELYFVAKLLNISVICYGNRNLKSKESIIRLMELANNIEPVDGGITPNKAQLQFYYGAMNCSKTAKLLYLKQDLELQNKRVCLIKPKLDRDVRSVVSRIGLKAEADIVLDINDSLMSFDNKFILEKTDIVLVDEAQFLTEKQINELRKIVDAYNIPIRCYGLKADFRTRHFSGSGRLLEIADQIMKLRTVCICGKGAEMNSRMDSKGNYIKEGDQIVIDSGNYMALCDDCYIEKVLKIDKERPEF